MSQARNIGGWLLEGRYWRNVVTGEYLPVIEGGGKAIANQQAFWFRNDDGDETGASWKTTGSNMNVSLAVGLSNRFRLRFVIEETAAGTINLLGRLFYSYNGGTYTTLTTGSSIIRAIDSINDGWSLTDDDPLTQQMAYSGTYVTGYFSNDGDCANVTLSVQHSELEYCLYIYDATGSSTIDIRVYDSAAALDNYNQTPRITVLETATPQTVTLNTLTLSGSAEALTVSPAATSITLNTLTLASSLESLIVNAPSTISLNELTLSSDLGDPSYTSVVFDGDKSLAISSSDASLDDIPDNYPFTIEAWIRQDTDVVTSFVSKGWVGISEGWYLQLNPTFGIRSSIRSTGTSAESRSGTDEGVGGDGEWHHLVMHFDRGGDNRIYFAKDGTWIGSYTAQVAFEEDYLTDASTYLAIGGLETEYNGGPDPGADPNSVLDGEIAWIAIWDNDKYGHEVGFTPPARNSPPTGSASGLIEAWGMQHDGDDLTALAVVNSANDANLYRCDWESEGLLVRIKKINVPLKPLTLASSAEAITVTPSAVSITLNTLTLAGSAEAINVSTIEPLTITLNELTLSSSAEAVTITPSAISTVLNELTLASSAEQLTVVAGVASIILNVLTLSSSLESLTAITPGAVSITLNELTLAGSAEDISQPAIITLDTLTLASSLESITIALGSVSIQLDTLTLASTLEDLTAITPGVVSLSLNELTLTSSPEAIAVTPAVVSISTNELTLASSLEDITVTPGAVSFSLNELTLTSSAVSLSVVTILIVALNELTLASSIETLTVTTPVSISLNELTLAGSAGAISVTLGAVSVSLNELTLASSTETITVIAGVATIVVDTLTLASTIEAITVAPSAISTTLDTLTLASSPEQITIAAPSTISVNTLTLASALQTLSVVSGAASLGLSTLILASTLLDLSITTGALAGLHGVSTSDIILQDTSITDSLLQDVGVSDQDGDI